MRREREKGRSSPPGEKGEGKRVAPPHLASPPGGGRGIKGEEGEGKGEILSPKKREGGMTGAGPRPPAPANGKAGNRRPSQTNCDATEPQGTGWGGGGCPDAERGGPDLTGERRRANIRAVVVRSWRGLDLTDRTASGTIRSRSTLYGARTLAFYRGGGERLAGLTREAS